MALGFLVSGNGQHEPDDGNSQPELDPTEFSLCFRCALSDINTLILHRKNRPYSISLVWGTSVYICMWRPKLAVILHALLCFCLNFKL